MKRASTDKIESPAAKRLQRFKPEYTSIFPALVASKISDHHVRCLVCDIDFKCSAGGKNDLSRHVDTASHKAKARPTNVTPLTAFFGVKEKESPSLAAVTRVEAMLTQVIVSHNLPFSAMDTLSRVIRTGFSDSKTASAFKCGRTKYFQKESEKKASSLATGKAKSLLDFFRSPTNQLFSTFLVYFAKQFDPVLVGLQAERPLIHSLRDDMETLLRTLMSKLVRPDKMLGQDIFEVDFKDRLMQRDDEDLCIGSDAMSFFIEESAKNHLRAKRLPDFYSGVRQCYAPAITYLKDYLPWQDRLLKAISLVDTRKQTSAKASDLLYLLRRFPCKN